MTTTSKGLVDVTIKSIHSKFQKHLTFLAVPKIADCVPSELFPREKINLPANIKLADPYFQIPRTVDMLIGAGTTLSLLSIGQINLSRDNQDLILQKTQLGWVVVGGLSGHAGKESVSCKLTELINQITKFWHIEEPTTGILDSSEFSECESHYICNTTRNESGRYVVRLPFRTTEQDFGDIRAVALRRFYCLQRNLETNPTLKPEYEKVMQNYIDSGHMSLVTDETLHGYYFPHHAVVKSTSLTTKVRVVFDASTKTNKGISLNDTLIVGPTIQDKLFEQLIRFRTHTFVMTADIEKMYRQILIHPDDRRFQRIFWFNENRISVFQLNTVTFGVSSAPFLAIRTLKQLADDEGSKFPIGEKIIRRDLYVDDLLTGANTLEELIQIRDEVIEILKHGGFNIRQWASNSEHALVNFDTRTGDIEFMINDSPIIKTLGISWNAQRDEFFFTVKPIALNERISKRNILSEIARIFDPLGILGPVILTAKVIMQECWKANISWDESVPAEIHSMWSSFSRQLELLNCITVERHLLIGDVTEIQIHGFGDASKVGYGACLYVRSRDKQGNILVRLVCAKSRVAPIKPVTIPRLELCGALVLARLYRETKSCFNFDTQRIIFWSDSMIVLHWLNKHPSVLKTFEANRVAEIQEIGRQVIEWRHVPTENNPADVISRGQFPRDFIENNVWFKGPEWLSDEEQSWPLTPEPLVTDCSGLKKPICLMTQPNSSEIFTRFSSFPKLTRVIAYCTRLLPTNHHKGKLTNEEVAAAEQRILKLIQGEQFADEINRISNEKRLKGSRFAALNPLIDTNGLLRVGGRLQRANLPFSQKHAILLPSHHHVTDLIIRESHETNYHSGIQSTLYNIRYRYWLLDGKNQVHKIIRQCVRCIRFRASSTNYLMGELPKSRVDGSYPFYHTGVDFFGPLFVKEKEHRNRNSVKTYGCLFVCMAVKAVHIEIVSDLSSDAFIAALRRFISRRATPKHIYSDNGTNFVGASNQIRDWYALMDTNEFQESVNNFALDKRIVWHFNPPFSPHFGGLWEAAVKSFKHHFKRVIGDRLFTYEELNTFATEIEAILNSRPLCPLSSDANDPSALSPAHFLVGRPLTMLPEDNCLFVPDNRLSSWRVITKCRQDFWRRWHLEYLNELQKRQKWTNGKVNLQRGQIVILIDKKQSCMRWPLGMIVDVHPGNDGVVRVVTIKTSQGEFKRNATTICPLLSDQIDQNK